MKQLIIILIFAFITFSFNDIKNPEREVIGKMELIRTSNDEIYIMYHGKVDECFMYHMIKRLYPECDTMEIYKDIDEIFKIEPNTNQRKI